MKGTVYKRCACKDPATGRPLNRKCPELSKRRHGVYQLDVRIDTTARKGHRLQRSGYATQTAAEKALDRIGDLLRLAGADDRMRRRVGDLIVEKSKHRGELPTAEDVRRKLGAGTDLNAPETTVAEWLEEWYAGKRGKKLSTRTLYRGHLDHYLIPLLGEIPRDKLRVEHVSGIFDTIEEWNAEVLAAKAGDRELHLPDDKRKVHRVVGIASQHRILATLRNAYNVAVKRPGMLDWNPCLAVELPPETRDPARVWSPEQVVQFLDATAEDRLGLLFRIVLLHGLRRGEALGLRWIDLEAKGRSVTVVQTVLHVGGKVIVDTPKSRAGARRVALDSGTAALIPAHRARQRRERLAAGEIWQDHGLIFCQQDGAPLSPDSVSKYFPKLAAKAKLPVIRLHEGRHTAATLGLEAGLDIKVVSGRLGHSTTRITQDLYTHVRPAVEDDAAEAILNLLPERKAAERLS